MNKPFNMRLPVLFAASLCAGILYSTVLAYFRLSGIFILIPCLIAFAACVPVAIIKGGVSKPLIIIVATVFFLVGAVYLYAKFSAFEVNEVLSGITVHVKGKVADTGVTSGGRSYLILSDVTVNGEKVSGKIAAYLTDSAYGYCRRGYSVEFYTQLEKQNFIQFGSVSYNACRGVKYICTVGGGINASWRFSLFGEINYAFERALFNNLDGETAAVCYAMLTGNTDAISEGTLASFRNGGIAHVFAVSGLHIGVIYGALTLISKKSGINRYVSTVIRIAFITVFSGVCLFSPSSVRALVMCSVSAVAGCFHRKHDGLNSLAASAVILLLINPLYLYEVGFVLSFAAVLGILLLSKNLSRLLGFLPKKISNALAVGFSVQISTVPVQLTSFGYISAAGLILNLVFIPLISALYVLLFICACVSAAIPAAAGVILPLSTAPIQLLINIVATCGFENAVISGSCGNWLYVPFALFFIGVTDKINVRPFLRAAFISAFALILLVSALATTVKSRVATVRFASGYSGGSVTVTTDLGTVLIVTENFEANSDIDVSANVLVVLGGYDSLSAVTSLAADYDAVFMRGDAFPLPSLGETPISYSDNFTACGIKFTYYGATLTVDVYGTKIALVGHGREYDAGSTGSDFELYCYRNEGALLLTRDGDYALDICGAMSYEISDSGYNLFSVVPKE